MTDTPSGDLARLHRWEDAGGSWRVVARRPGSLTIALCRCDGGEEVERLTTGEPTVLDHVGARETSEEQHRGRAD